MAGIVITTQPVSSTVVKNRTNTLSVLATATAGTLNYNWYEDAATDVLLQSGTSNTFVPLPLTLSKSYYVKVWTSDAPTVFVTSNTVTITVIDPPVISTEPAPVSIRTGESATLNVVVAPTPNLTPYSYQWYIGSSGVDDNPIAGATSSSYVISNLNESSTFWVRVSTGADYVNSNSARVTVTEPLFNDDEAIRQQKNDALGGSFGSQNMDGILSAFPLESITVLSQAQSLADCAKNIPNRLMDMALKFATAKTESALRDATGVTFEDLQRLKDQYDKVQKIVEKIQNFNPKEITLQQALAGLQKLTGVDLIQQTNKVLNDFAAVSGISGIVEQALNSDFCKVSNYGLDGKPISAITNIPMGVPPSSVTGVAIPIGTAEYDSGPKDEYDSFTFQLKEYTETDSALLASYSGTDKENYVSSISYLHTIALAYHDKISKTVDDSKDAQYREEFDGSIELTVAQHPSWSADILADFTNRGRIISDIINRNAQVIRNFLGVPTVGGFVSKGVTTYSGPESDFTTFLDIKPSQRPPELTQKYLAQGKYIPSGTTYTNSAGKTFKIGTLNYSDAFKGAYGSMLVSDRSVASTRFPGGSIIALKNPDGSPYNPTGKNSSGQYIVDDTGNIELTWRKVDIFTTTPELYKNMDSVGVYLVKEGSKKGQKYQTALARYGKGY
jgi:hypothetical protein